MKKGRISKEEQGFIEANLDRHTVEEIAAKLDRDPVSVEKFIKKNFRVGVSQQEEAEYDLEGRPYYQEIKEQFTNDELKLFKYHWSRIVSQFRDDVIPTEELQIVDLIKMELLMNRALKQNKENVERISALESFVWAERQRDPDQQDHDMIINNERQIASLRASMETLNRDYRDLQTKKSSMLKDMKATREQRVKRLEDSKQSFTGWIAHLMSNPDLASDYGVEMEKMRMAMEVEKQRLAQYHKYTDGQIDRPFLNAETVMLEESDDE